MSLACLRPGLPAAYGFSVTQQPHRVKLDQNESAVDLPAELKGSIADELAGMAWNRYIQPASYVDAKRGLGDALGIDPDRLALTCGADQALEAAFLVGGGPGRTARWFEPTYPYIAHAARRTFTEADPVELGAEIDSAISVEHVSGDIFVVASPNNPTGGLVPGAVLDAALAEAGRLVVVDEAYIDFAQHTEATRAADNLMIVRSLSKASIAGLHLGYVIAHPEAIAAAERMYTAPYHLNALLLLVARRFGEIKPHVDRAAAGVIAERARVFEALDAMDGIAPHPSRANFILFAVRGGAERAARLHRVLTDDGVRIRSLGGLASLSDFLRVTIGTRAENDAFLTTLRAALAAD